MSLCKPSALLAGRRVLIVEDEVLIAMDMETTLRDAGCGGAQLAHSLEAAGVAFEKGNIDFAVLDVNLGGKNVFGLARDIRRRRIPFIFLSGYNREHVVPNEFRECVCLEKPVSDALLVRAAAGLFAAQE